MVPAFSFLHARIVSIIFLDWSLAVLFPVLVFTTVPALIPNYYIVFRRIKSVLKQFENATTLHKLNHIEFKLENTYRLLHFYDVGV